jgi:dUTP pyrophosphatase
LSKSGYILSNNIGIIDNSYRGNLLIALTKVDDSLPDIRIPFRCCQLIVRKQVYTQTEEVYSEQELGTTNRGNGGFGSSGIL